MKKYSSYKPSGIEWLETIPENWEVSKLKYLGNLFGGLTGKSGGDFNNEENPKNKPYIPYTNIFNNTYISKDHFHYVSIDEGESQNRVKKNDMFFLMSSETHKDLGKSCILIDDVDELYLNSFCKGFRIKDKNIQPLFLNYQILGHLHREMISVEGKGFTRINLRQDKINDLVVFYPPLQEQEQIVKYLDEKTSVIDKLISTKERKIELLKEQRTSLINEVITKGLNPNEKLKESGVEWIGDIPESWEIVPLFTISKHTKEKNVDDEKVVLSLSYGNIKIRDVENNYGLLPESFNDYQRIRPGYIVLRLTDLQNDKKSLRVGLSKLDGIITPVYVSLKTNHKMLDEFLFYHLYNSDLKKILYTLGGGLRQTLRFDELKKFPVPFTTLEEQKEIVEYINKNINEIDELILSEQKKIELLKEYRQTLISEIITGKIKVM